MKTKANVWFVEIIFWVILSYIILKLYWIYVTWFHENAGCDTEFRRNVLFHTSHFRSSSSISLTPAFSLVKCAILYHFEKWDVWRPLVIISYANYMQNSELISWFMIAWFIAFVLSSKDGTLHTSSKRYRPNSNLRPYEHTQVLTLLN